MPQDKNAAFPHIVVTSDDDDDIVIQAGVSTSAQSKDATDTSAANTATSNGTDSSLNTGKTPTESADNTNDPEGDISLSTGKTPPTPVENEASDEKSCEPSPNESPTDKTSQNVSTDNMKNASEPHTKKASGKTPKEDTYHETTLEDIENTKMSTMQKIIIVLAIIVIIGFVIYYFAFAR